MFLNQTRIRNTCALSATATPNIIQTHKTHTSRIPRKTPRITPHVCVSPEKPVLYFWDVVAALASKYRCKPWRASSSRTQPRADKSSYDVLARIYGVHFYKSDRRQWLGRGPSRSRGDGGVGGYRASTTLRTSARAIDRPINGSNACINKSWYSDQKFISKSHRQTSRALSER